MRHYPTAPENAPPHRWLSLAERLAPKRPLQWESCEPRLALSAQLLSDAIDPFQLQMHGALQTSLQSPLLDLDTGAIPQIEPHTALAHQLSGRNAMQQEFGIKGLGQTVAVIDSGVAWDHVALGNGFGPGYRVVGGWDFAENDSNPYDDGPTGFHGTHVAGIVGSDNAQYSGVASDVDLVALRVFNDAGKGQINWVEQALNWVHNNRNSFANPITTVNLSLGTTWNALTVPSWGTLEDELKQLYDDGIIVTASAGNSFKQYNAPGLSYPAASPYVLPVASVDDNGLLSDFSQRSERVLAAPGRNITSTVPDHVLGRDGKINDFSSASGTSMAAPYVAGAAVLVREAMEMVGVNNISSARIINWLRDTSDTVFDAVTNASYDRLNLQRAIDTLIPDDNIGDTIASAKGIDLTEKSLDGWLNHLGDSDVYRFTTNAAGQLTLDADSEWLESVKWELTKNGQTVATAGLTAHSLRLQANQTYELRISADKEIGPYQLGLAYQADKVTPPAGGETGPVINLGNVDYLTKDVAAGSTYRATATYDGLFTVQWQNSDSAKGTLSVRDASGVLHSDATWEGGALRLDMVATAGQTFNIQIPGSRSDTGTLTLADVVQVRGRELNIRDTGGSEVLRLDLSRSVALDYGNVQYEFQTGQVARIAIDGAMNTDQLSVVGSALADKVDLKPGFFTLENSQLNVTARGIEQVHFDSGWGASDRLYLYDSDGDDTLTARPGSAELTGVGYRFSVENVDRLFVHASGQGQDMAYMYDSAGNDQLSVRPQFTSLWGDGYFSSVRGFERVYVYATAGGFDTANLYDSAGNDRFSSGGEAASIVGTGFFSYTRYFEQVHAHATAGGHDIATLYGSNQQTQWQRGSDFISFKEGNWDRNAQGFEKTEAFVNGLAQAIPNSAALSVSMSSTTNADAHPNACSPAQPIIAAAYVDMNTAHQAVDRSIESPIYAIVESHQSHAARNNDGLRFSANQEYTPHSVNLPQSASQDFETAAEMLLDALDLRQELNATLAADELYWHTNPNAERDLLDEIFSRFGRQV